MLGQRGFGEGGGGMFCRIKASIHREGEGNGSFESKATNVKMKTFNWRAIWGKQGFTRFQSTLFK